MRRCASCDFWFAPSSPGQDACPRCGQASVETAGHAAPGRVPIARAANWAEAGFFEDLLTRHELEPEIIPREQFDALAGCWSQQLVILVPREDADRAADLIELELRHDAEPGALAGEFAPPSADAGGPFWKPVVFLLLATGLIYWIASRASARPENAQAAQQAGHKRPANDLWDQLSRSSRPWRQTSADGATRILWRDPQSGSVHLKADTDGDGRFDRWLEFREGRKVRDVPLNRLQPGPEPAF